MIDVANDLRHIHLALVNRDPDGDLAHTAAPVHGTALLPVGHLRSAGIRLSLPYQLILSHALTNAPSEATALQFSIVQVEPATSTLAVQLVSKVETISASRDPP